MLPVLHKNAGLFRFASDNLLWCKFSGVTLIRYFVCILTNYDRTVLYTGVTNNLSRRLQEHAEDAKGPKLSFAGKYNCVFLVYVEEYTMVNQAIAREKEVKNLRREHKMALIHTCNPDLQFLNGDL